ncbi:hypothetical protein N7532_002228 [Penicillium argentinense]|uniref:S-adenosyl-L-methionine-dependent methyltransferase n=1 Tax=Penicillium argentinense TaxID=1131581 RepID=A0A9W9G016_9EURO|nr:uncharacterized protein N7532_002228 [Penicillium argentinense]KAJ5109583.1 hypothetical protein N7532_002228 [Penicillium argentinense]
MTDPAATSNIQVDSDVNSLSDYESIRSDLTSLTESVYSYVYENGRTYHAYRSGSYVLPNDEREQDRMDVLHHVFRLTLNGELCQTELDNPIRVLDIGTGTGIWAIEVADQFPAAEVIGVDLSPIQPGWVPPNLRFVIEDINQPDWSFAEGSFDFIHVRSLAGSIDDWPLFLRQCYDHLKPGGRIEITECNPHLECDDDSWPADSHLRTWESEFHRITAIQGRVWDLGPRIRSLLQDAAFEDIQVTGSRVPVGTWPKDPKLKEIGRYFRAQLADGAIESYSLALFTRFGNWTSAEVQVFLAQLRAELRSNKAHVYTRIDYVTAQRPR